MLVPRGLGAAALLTAALLGSSCGDDGGGPATTTTTSAAATARATTAAAPPGGIDPMPGASTKPVHRPATNRRTALLTAVRAARHEGFDRVVFQFANVLPGYDVRYVRRPVTQDGSGKVVRVTGAHVLRVRMENALDADLAKPGAPRTYTGPRRFTPATPEVAELVWIGGFEAVLTWAIGVRDRADFRVLALKAPPRLVVDVRNH